MATFKVYKWHPLTSSQVQNSASAFVRQLSKRCLHSELHVDGHRNSFIACIEGNIGSGKTLLISHIRRQYPTLRIVEEPVNQWTDFHGYNLLQMMYSNPERWSALFQSHAMLTMVRGHRKAASCGGDWQNAYLMERSLHSCAYIFLQSLRIRRLMHECDYQNLLEWYRMWAGDPIFRMDLIVYLRASPDVCLRRVRQRQRQEEVSIDLDLLTQLHHLHDAWLADPSAAAVASRVIHLDADCPAQSVADQWDRAAAPLMGAPPVDDARCLVS